MDYTAYASAADPNYQKSLTSRSQSKVKFSATFPHKYCSVNPRQPDGPFVLKFSIKAEGDRCIMINTVAPIVGLQSVIDRDILSGLPCIVVRELHCQGHPRNQPVFSLKLDVFYLDEYHRREELSPPDFNPKDFAILGPEGYEGEYILNQPFEFLQSRVACGIMSPGRSYHLDTGPLNATCYKCNDGSCPDHQPRIKTVPVELDSFTMPVFSLTD
ncbi:hypothetical protein PV08_07802 [Exophiala spinifera]|uniref:Uncharacterized protein n=1 Tax=Exophiala spinifera TaxID=91928 RepID=A0A0D2B8Q4_9EURO|nr:uncharacterized protein PV08_07802 [Exophiala spinifera]KIW15015.1 hypothetical protein PV08_07802 [Exophiala spinifera]